jgi:hypothetical protein
MATVFTILAGLALTLSTVSWGMDVWKAGALESNKSYSAAALDQVRQHQAQAEADLAAARREGDPIAVARAQARRDALVMLEERWDPSASVRQAEQARSAFIEEGQRKAMIDIGTRIVSSGVGGFGKVQGSYMRGTNWPPTGANVAYWDPQAGQAVRVILGTDRPTLEIVEFKDNLEDAMSMVMGLFDVLKGTKGTEQEPLTARDTYEGVREGLERLQDLDALPTTIGEYVGKAMERQIQVENPQIASLTKEERDAFAQELACARLQGLWQAESDRARSDSYAAALAWFGCPPPTSRTASTEEEAVPEEPQTTAQEEEQVVEPAVVSEAAPAGVWVRVGEPILNRDNEALSDRFPSSGTPTHVTDFGVDATSFRWQKTTPDGELDIGVSFEAPETLVPGQEIALTVSFTGTSTMHPSAFRTDIEMGTGEIPRGMAAARPSGSLPSYMYDYMPWDPGFSGPSSVTLRLYHDAPLGQPGETLDLWLNWWPCWPCDVTWTYRFE